MRDESTPAVRRIVLSERNLRTLVNKLQDPDSARTLYLPATAGEPRVEVVAEHDAIHYAGRSPGYTLHAPPTDDQEGEPDGTR